MSFLPEPTLRDIVAAYARIRSQHGAVLASPVLVEPTSQFFPDTFSGDVDSIGRLFRRIVSYAPLASDLQASLSFVDGRGSDSEEAACGTGGCSTSTTSAKRTPRLLVASLGEHQYDVPISTANVSNPALLVATLAHQTGSLILLEAGEVVSADEFGPTSELAACAAGLGVVLLNGSCVYMKACSALRAHQATDLSPPELALAVALFIRLHGLKAPAVRAHLEVTQREAFDEAIAWVDSNPALVGTLRDRPELLTDGVFQIEARKSWLSRFFGRKVANREEAPVAIAVKAPVERSAEESRRLSEARALVDEALSGST